MSNKISLADLLKSVTQATVNTDGGHQKGPEPPANRKLEWFVYPRLLGNTVWGYDFGYFMSGLYVVCGNSKTRDMAVNCINEGFWPGNIIHEDVPSDDKHMQERGKTT